MAKMSVRAGSRVRVTGLVKAAEYNGQEGTVEHSAAASADGRLCVVLEGGKELSLKPENAEVLGEHIERAGGPDRESDIDFLLSGTSESKGGAADDGVTGTFDWIVDYPQIKQYLTCEFLGVERSARILQVGCGTSELGAKVYDSGFANVTNVDIDAPTIEVRRP
jgi:hypothetical protein